MCFDHHFVFSLLVLIFIRNKEQIQGKKKAGISKKIEEGWCRMDVEDMHIM